MKKGQLTPEQYVTDLNGMLASFLESKAEFQKETKEFFTHNPPKEKKLEEMRKLKVELNKKAKSKDATNEDKANARQSNRAYSHLKKVNKEQEEVAEKKRQEKCYKENFYKTARDVTNGVFGQPESKPIFTKTTADLFYKNKYETPVEVDLDKLDWFPNVEKPSTPYNVSPYTPKDIRKALKKKDKYSAPGFDDIVYAYLIQMPFLHQALATVFTRIRDEGFAPDDWAKSKIILLKKTKDESDEDPTSFRMISLTLNIGKLYHTLEAGRTLQFMLLNKYLDSTAQKAYVDGVNGCVEHVVVVQEVIQHARLNNKTANITWFDLQDAFGSVPHVLIPHVMKHYHIPEIIITYVTSLYSKLEGKVVTDAWESEVFKFLRGVFAGDPFSGMIFIVVFNPIIEYIKKHQETHGYPITTKNSSVKNVITTPFADDFNIITSNNTQNRNLVNNVDTQHQNLVTDVENKINSMGLVIKPKKCRSLSIVKGKTVNIPFQVTDQATKTSVDISSVIDKPLKFLGSRVAEDNTPRAMFVSLNSKLKEKLENIDKSMLRGEHKVNIYSRYALPSLRYYFSVHQIHQTQMNEMDNLAKIFLKKWLGFQKHGVSDVAIYHPLMLGIKDPSQMYMEAHASNHASMRTKGDQIVNHALNSRLEREERWTRKFSTARHMENLWQEHTNSPTPHPTQPLNSHTQIEVAKNVMKKSINQSILTKWNERVKQLTFQGDFVKLIIEENEDVTWKSICNNIPKGVLSFALKATTNGLNTPDNLKRWGIRQTNKCELCGNWSNLEHILNWCSVSKDQKRTTWRHDSVLNHMVQELKKHNPHNLTIYADIPGHKCNNGTIPPDITLTTSRPDLVIIDKKARKIDILELTCSYEKNIESANTKKFLKYFDLKEDILKAGWSVNLVPFEIGSRGMVTKRNKTSLMETFKRYQLKVKHKQLMKDLSKISLLCSYVIFQARTEPIWETPPLLHP